MNRNIEIKAVSDDLRKAHAVARKIGATLHSVEEQSDIYFRASRGRLKLRQRCISGPAQSGRRTEWELISYDRPDSASPKASDYSLIRVIDGPELRQLLADGLGILVEVHKRRTVYLYDNVRIHLDDVENLGSFIEFEAIVDGPCSDTSAHDKLDGLLEAFQIQPQQLVDVSYSDLLRSASSSSMSASNLSRS